MNSDLLQVVRRAVLEMRAARDTKTDLYFGLSHFVWKIMPHAGSDPYGYLNHVSRYTSGGPKKLRGHVQACLATLAREGIVYSRTKPEPGVARYEHGEIDKRFQTRVTHAEAKKRLARYKSS